MRLRIISLILTPALGLLCPNIFLASGAKPQSPQRAAAQVTPISEADLTERFNRVLDKELSGANVCVAPSAARKLAELMKAAASRIVQTKAFGRVGEAEKNIQKLAGRLAAASPDGAGRVRITSETIDRMFEEAPVKVDPSEGGLCPLFPIC